jgi:hypothetical protein
MGILLWVLGAVALGSGVIKLRAPTRALVGRSPLALAEVGGGAVVLMGAAFGLARQRVLAWLCVGVVVVLVAASSVAHARLLARRAEERDRSAERRFREYMEMPER